MKITKNIVVVVGLTSSLVACSTSKTVEDTTKVAPQVAKESTLKTIDLSYMDLSVKPSDDFFQFANGTWAKNNPVPAQESTWGSFNELEQNNMIKLTDILSKAKTSSFDKADESSILGNFYQSYVNIAERNERGNASMIDQLKAIDAMKSKKELVTMMASMHNIGISSLFGVGVGQDMMDVKKNVIYLSQDGLGLPSKEYYTEKYADIASKYMEYVHALFVANSYKATEKQEFGKEVFKFESMLAENMMGPAELRIPELSYNKQAVSDIQKTFTNFDFGTYLQLINAKKTDSIVVGQPLYLKALNSTIKEASLDHFKMYLKFCIMNHYASYLDTKNVDLSFGFYSRTLSGKKEMKPINEMAINKITRMSMGEILGKEFVKLYFSEEANKKVNVMVDNLLAAFEERLNGLTWMTDPTKKEALIKLHAIGRKLGYPSKWESFATLKMDKDDLKGNIDRANAYDHAKNMAELGQPIDLEKWEMPAHMINAYYHPLLNEIAFPAGIMQAPFFDVNAEDAVNYGRIGMVIGHEFTHGFDDMGSKFGADGSFTNWWKDEDREAFEKNTNLLGKTFSNFCPVKDHCVNPELTMGENIADLGGITMAFYAYMKTEEFKSGVKVNGYTPAQRFFIAFAQLWKINYKDEELKNRISNDPHSPGMYRVNGPLMNCPEFFKAFGIQEGAKMRNSNETISRIW